MALVVEDGSLVEGANTYVSLADAIQYVNDRGYGVTLTEGHVLRGADYINSFAEVYKGQIVVGKTKTLLSTMQWPRSNVYLEGSYDCLPKDKIPGGIIHAQIETAYEIANARDPLATVSTRVIKKQKVDVIETEYDNTRGSGQATFDYRRVMAYLYQFIDTRFGEVVR